MQVAKFKDIKMQLLKDMCLMCALCVPYVCLMCALRVPSVCLMCALRVPYVCLVAIVVCMYRLSHTPYM